MTPLAPELTAAPDVGSRALRLIADGVIDRSGVSGLAAALGCTPRHVLRSVTAVAGCGPIDVARWQRARVARMLLSDTTLPMSHVAAGAGFATVRQFNLTVRAMTGCTPSEIRFGRQRAVAAPHHAGPAVVRCALPFAQPVPAEVFADLAASAVPGVEEGQPNWFDRAVRLPHGAGHVRVDRRSSGTLVAGFAVSDLRDVVPLMNRTRTIFSGGSIPRGGEALVTLRGRIGATDTAEEIIRRRVALSVGADSARVVLGGLATQLGEATAWGVLFPTAAAIAARGRSVLRGPRSVVDTILRTAEAVADGRIVTTAGFSCAELTAQHEMLQWP